MRSKVTSCNRRVTFKVTAPARSVTLIERALKTSESAEPVTDSFLNALAFTRSISRAYIYTTGFGEC